LDARQLDDADGQHASQSIVKERLTRKVFWQQGIAGPLEPNADLKGAPVAGRFCGAMRTLRLCAFGGQGQGRMSQTPRIRLWISSAVESTDAVAADLNFPEFPKRFLPLARFDDEKAIATVPLHLKRYMRLDPIIGVHVFFGDSPSCIEV
jgi:hypothetical protein